MRINHLSIRNYRTLENVDIELPGFYSAISGKNNCGKTNVVKVIRSFFEQSDEDPYFEDAPTISMKTDFPNWKHFDEARDAIILEMNLLVHRERDAGLFRFVTTFLGLTELPDELSLCFTKKFSRKGARTSIHLKCNGTEVTEDFKVDEVFKKLRTSKSLLFHNSTEQAPRYFYRRQFAKLFGSLSGDEADKMKKANQRLVNLLKRAAQRHQKEIIELLGRLEEKYDVTLSVPPLDFEGVPLMVSLGDKKSPVPLDEWGSGTQNRTLILLKLLRAKKNREAASESDRITPVLLIEEPESFLHPSAQAEFGKMLQDLAEELSVQVLTTTHSPYMLSLSNPKSNVLLNRRIDRNRLVETQIAATDGENWMEPFGLALGIDNEAFSNWRHVLFKKSNQILLVEGETDKNYLEMLRSADHGANALKFEGEIFPYGGTGFFSNTILIKFVMSRFSKFAITYDLDRDAEISKQLQNLGLKKNVQYFPIGIDSAGRKDIEGLLPDNVRGTVYSKNSDLVAVATSTDKQSQSARRQLKTKLYEEFKTIAVPGDAHFGEFYKVTKLLNKALR